jgi:hypothetical protein
MQSKSISTTPFDVEHERIISWSFCELASLLQCTGGSLSGSDGL